MKTKSYVAIVTTDRSRFNAAKISFPEDNCVQIYDLKSCFGKCYSEIVIIWPSVPEEIAKIQDYLDAHTLN